MAMKFTPRLVELTYEAALKSFWRKGALKKFLRASNISDSFLSNWGEDESKRIVLDRLFMQLQSSDRGKAAMCQMAKHLSELTSFPDLQGWEETKKMVAEATKAISELRAYVLAQEEQAKTEKEREEFRKRAQEERLKIQKSLTDKASLQSRLDSLHSEVGTQPGGYKFQDWFYDLIDYCEIRSRRPYVTEGRQIDGSLTLDGTTYLVELKFTGEQAGATDIDSLRAKVEDKADNTMGIMVSISGYSSVAVTQAGGRKSVLLLLDASHLYLFMSGSMSFADIVGRVRRHASQTAEAYLPVAKFSG